MTDSIDPDSEIAKLIRRYGPNFDDPDGMLKGTLSSADKAVRAVEISPCRFDDAVMELAAVLYKFRWSCESITALNVKSVSDEIESDDRDREIDELDRSIIAQRDAILAAYRLALIGGHPDQQIDLRREWAEALLEDYTDAVRADERLGARYDLQGPDPGSLDAKTLESTGARLRAAREALLARIKAL